MTSKDSCGDTPPPDGGWGWVVMFASFVIHFILGGVLYAFGIFYLEIAAVFESTKAETALIPALLVGGSFLFCPVSASIVNRWGFRVATGLGGLLSCLAFSCSFFATSVVFLICTLGLVSGFSLSLIFFPSVVCVAHYFDTKRTLALGLSATGGGVGTFAFAPIFTALIEEYALRGTLLITGALLLNISALGLLFLPLKTPPSNIHTEKPPRVCSEEKPYDVPESPTAGTFKEASNNKHNLMETASAANLRSPEFVDKHWESDGKLLHSQTSNLNESRLLSLPNVSLANHLLFSDFVKTSTAEPKTEIDDTLNNSSDSLLLGLEEEETFSSDCRIRKIYSCDTFDCCDSVEKQHWDAIKPYKQSKLYIYKDVKFLCLAASSFLFQAGAIIPFLHLVAQAVEIGVNVQKASFLISTLGIANIIGRGALGVLFDRPRVVPVRMLCQSASLTACGLSTALCFLYSSFISLSSYAAVFGFFAVARRCSPSCAPTSWASRSWATPSVSSHFARASEPLPDPLSLAC